MHAGRHDSWIDPKMATSSGDCVAIGLKKQAISTCDRWLHPFISLWSVFFSFFHSAIESWRDRLWWLFECTNRMRITELRSNESESWLWWRCCRERGLSFACVFLWRTLVKDKCGRRPCVAGLLWSPRNYDHVAHSNAYECEVCAF